MESFVSRNVRFHEHIFPFQSTSQHSYMTPYPSHQSPLKTNPFLLMMTSCLSLLNPTLPLTLHTSFSKSHLTLTTTNNTNLSPLLFSNFIKHSTSPCQKTTRTYIPPFWHQDYVAHSSTSHISNLAHTYTDPQFHCFLTSLTSTLDPVSFKEVVAHTHWVTTMNSELEALESNNTWDVVTLPHGKTAIGSKWLFRTKLNPDGTIE